jgi:hypothetical protein
MVEEQKQDDPREPDVRWLWLAGAAGALILLITYLRFRNGFAVGSLADHANLGNALQPIVAFLTLLAVVAALWSVQVQRVELALQRKELQGRAKRWSSSGSSSSERPRRRKTSQHLSNDLPKPKRLRTSRPPLSARPAFEHHRYDGLSVGLFG